MKQAFKLKAAPCIITGILLVAACTNNFEREDKMAYDPSKVICFTTDVATKGTPVNAESEMTDMGVFCSHTDNDWETSSPINKMNNTKLTRNTSSGAWEYSGNPVAWDITSSVSERYSFFAYAPFASGTGGNGLVIDNTVTTGTPSLTYTVPSNCSDQPDLMVAVPRKNIHPTSSAVPLTMKHALTCVGFQIKGNGERVTRIALTGVSVSGSLAIDGDNILWSNLGNHAITDFSASINYDSGKSYHTTSSTLSTNLIADDGYLMMIPQTLGTDAQLKVTFVDLEQNTVTESFSLNTKPAWTAGEKVNYNITISPPVISVSPSMILIPATGVSSSETQYKFTINLTKGPLSKITVASANAPSWVGISDKLGDPGKTSLTIQSVNFENTIYVTASSNSGNSSRVQDINIDYYNLYDTNPTTITVKVLQKGTQTPNIGDLISPQESYVGAFWKKDQKGERLIKIPVKDVAAVGSWSASVVWMDPRWSSGDIVFDNSNYDAITIPTETAENGDAENASWIQNTNTTSVSGNVTAATGTSLTHENYIYFRIGLKSTYTPTINNPARYAVIAISYNNNSKFQLLLLRQGEDPDIINSGTGAPKWSVYNLNGFGGPFTDYPTQAGYFKQWSSAKTMYPPISTISWFDEDPTTFADPSPAGYMVPYFSGTSYDPSIGQMYSLITDGTENAWGYYADGYFDRGKIVDGLGSKPDQKLCAVNITDDNVAYAGRLFFNLTNFASIFLPASGLRDKGTGQAQHTGLGYYHSATPNMDLSFTSSSSAERTTYYFKNWAFPIRCIKSN